MRFIKVLKSRQGKKTNLAAIDRQICIICQKFRLKLLYLFGSYAENNAGKLSDIDIAVLPGNKLSHRRTLDLISILQDIFQDEAVDLVDLRNASPALIHRVIKGKCLYAKDLQTKIEFEVRAESEYYDTQPLRDEYFQAMFERIHHGTYGH